MEARAIKRHLRMSPRKVDQVVRLIRGKQVGEAINTLHFTRKNACLPIEKTLRSAVANLMNKEDATNINEEELVISEAYVTEGPMLKRFRPMSHGRAGLIRKRTAHLTIVVKENA